MDNYKLNCIKEYGMLYVDFNNYIFDSIQKINVKCIYEQQINENKNEDAVDIHIDDDTYKNMHSSLIKDNMNDHHHDNSTNHNVDVSLGVDRSFANSP